MSEDRIKEIDTKFQVIKEIVLMARNGNEDAMRLLKTNLLGYLDFLINYGEMRGEMKAMKKANYE